MSSEFADGPYAPGDVSVLHALLTEAWGTAILAFVIFALTHPRNSAAATADALERSDRRGGGGGGGGGGASSSMHIRASAYRPGVPLAIGATVAALLAMYAPITQAGWNPARDFGPRIVAACAGWGRVAIPGPRSGFWIYIAGPFIGAPAGALFADRAVWRHSK